MGLATHRFWVLWLMEKEARTPLTIAREWLSHRHRLVAKAATCGMCMTLWSGLGIYLGWCYAPLVVYVLALSELVGWLEAGMKKLGG